MPLFFLFLFFVCNFISWPIYLYLLLFRFLFGLIFLLLFSIRCIHSLFIVGAGSAADVVMPAVQCMDVSISGIFTNELGSSCVLMDRKWNLESEYIFCNIACIACHHILYTTL